MKNEELDTRQSSSVPVTETGSPRSQPDGSGPTPGPWAVESFSDQEHVVVKAGTNWLIAEIGTMAPLANAHLIAAAPDLLDVVRRTAAYFEGTDAPLGLAALAALEKAERR